jgi:predicted DNA-binding transcriptional regulator YafY
MTRTEPLPPLDLAPEEAVAVAVALLARRETPFEAAAQSALGKLVAAMGDRDAEVARALAERVRLVVGEPASPPPPPVPSVLAQAVVARQVLVLEYEDVAGSVTRRTVEPVAFVANDEHWYLVGWCRLRRAGRAFRVDRVRRALMTGEPAPPRRYDDVAADVDTELLRVPAVP